MLDILLGSEVNACFDADCSDILICANGIPKMRISPVAAQNIVNDLTSLIKGETPATRPPPIKPSKPRRKPNAASDRTSDGRFTSRSSEDFDF